MKKRLSTGTFISFFLSLTLMLSACAKNPSGSQSSAVEKVQETKETELLSSAPSNLPQVLVSSVEATQQTEGNYTDGGVITDPNAGSNGSGDGGVIARPLLPARLVANPAAYDFGVRSIQSINHAVIQITNVGEMAAVAMGGTGLNGVFQFRGGAYPGTLGTCGGTLARDESCLLVVSFRPTATQAYQAQLSVNYSGTNLAVPFRGKGTGIATLRISNLINDNDHYNYGPQTYGSQTIKTFRVIYSGVKPATGVVFSGVSGYFSILRNECSEIVGADCELDIAFNANTSGLQSRKLKVTYHNSAYSAETHHDLYGEASPQTIPAVLQIDNYGFGDRLIGGNYERVIRVRKTGNLPATQISENTFLNSAFSFKGGQYPGEGGTCQREIHTDCLIVVSFNPDNSGSLSDRVALNYFDGANPRVTQNRLTGRGVLPAFLTLSPAPEYSADFGNISLNYPRDQVFLLSNGSGRMRAVNVFIPPLFDQFSVVATNCGSTLLSGRQCSITVRFTPLSTETVQTTLMAHYYDAVENQVSQLPIQGRGDDGATLTFGGDTYDFGSIVRGETTYLDIEIHYYGTLVAEGCEISISDPTGGGGDGPVFGFPTGDPFGTGTCTPGGINQSCTFRIVFTPVSETIYRTEIVLTYQTGTGTTETITVPIVGTGLVVDPALLQISSIPSFGRIPVGSGREMRVTIQREGELSATNIEASIEGSDFHFLGGTYPGSGGSCSEELALHQSSCQLVLEYTPSQVGASTGELVLNYFDGVLPQQTRSNLSGEGFRAAHLAMVGLPFGKLPLGASGEAITTVTNTGTDTATSISIGGISEPFAVLSNECPAQLEPNQSCQITVQVSGDRPGNFQNLFSAIYHNGEGVTQSTAAAQAKVTVPVQVGANGNHTCARTELGAIKCWGHGALGQLGLGDSSNRGDSPGEMGGALAEVNLGTDRWAKKVALGYWHTCAILDDGSLKCWGDNQNGQLGIGSNAQRMGAQPHEMGDDLPPVDLGEEVVEVAAGYQHTCALTSSGRVSCFGDNGEGQLGLGHSQSIGGEGFDPNDSFVELGSPAVSISAGPSHSCARLETGAIKCWGNNLFGQLAQGDTDNRGDDPNEMDSFLREIHLAENTSALQVSAGGAFTCALDENHQVRCWGRNENGILGNSYCQDFGAYAGNCSDSNFSFPLPGLGISLAQIENELPRVELGADFSANQISTSNGSACALSGEGQVKCWGENQYGQLGLGDTNSRGLSSTEMGDALSVVSLPTAAREISNGSQHACAVLQDESLYCWGYNKYGSLGTGDTENRGDQSGESPVRVLIE